MPSDQPELRLEIDPLNLDGEFVTFEAVATTGEGVFPTLKALAGLVLESLNRDRRRTGGVGGMPSTPAVPASPTPAATPVLTSPLTESHGPARRIPAAACAR